VPHAGQDASRTRHRGGEDRATALACAMQIRRSMKRRWFPLLLGASLALACTRSSEERDSRIGRTTYDGADQLQPASRFEKPRADPTIEPPFEGEEADARATEPPAVSGAGAAGGSDADVPDVVYVPTPQAVVDKMLEVARVRKDDLVYDLGCGDGRIVVTAAMRYGARAVGFDIDPARVAEARANVKAHGLEDLVRIERADIFTLDLAKATVVTLYLLPELNDRLVPQLERLAAGSRVVSHDYDMTGIVPTREHEMKPPGDDRAHSVFLYTLPFQRPRGPTLPPPVAQPPIP
jgi:SAM-dependent methyltransferase